MCYNNTFQEHPVLYVGSEAAGIQYKWLVHDRYKGWPIHIYCLYVSTDFRQLQTLRKVQSKLIVLPSKIPCQLVGNFSGQDYKFTLDSQTSIFETKEIRYQPRMLWNRVSKMVYRTNLTINSFSVVPEAEWCPQLSTVTGRVTIVDIPQQSSQRTFAKIPQSQRRPKHGRQREIGSQMQRS